MKMVADLNLKDKRDRKENRDLIARHLAPEIITGYVFWSFFCGFGPAIWFYPLNELDITGYEAFLTVLLLPSICGIPPVLRALQSKWGLAFLRLLASACLGIWYFPTTLSRLIVMATGTGACLLLLVTTLWSHSAFQRYVTFWGHVLGFFAILVTRVWYRSLLPTWADPISNTVIASLAFIAAFDIIISGFYTKTATPKKNSSKTITKSWIAIAIGFGSLLYITVAIFGEVSVVSRWIVTGYPHPGPQPNPWGAFILVSLMFGIYLSVNQYMYSSSLLRWCLGTCSLYGLYRLNHWPGFFAGCIFAVYIMSLWPKMIDNLTLCPPARTFSLAMLTYIIEILFSIWTVAYNFVPGGVYTREHTGYLLIFISFALLLPFYTDENNNSISHTAFVKDSTNPEKTKLISYILFLLLLLGLSGFAFRISSFSPKHKLSENPKGEFTALIWTFHFGFDNTGLPSYERAATVIQDTGADFITLLESDASKPFLGNNDIATWMAERLDMYSDFGPSTRDHTWGNLILSKYPIIASDHHLLPSPHGELAPAISATVNISGQLIDFVTTHMGNDRDNLDRKLQAEYLAKLLHKSKNPVVFLGYVTSAPQSRDYKQLTIQGKVSDIDPTDNDRWCQYIMYRGLIRLGYARLSHGGLSDTEIQLAKFKIPGNHNFVDNEILERDSSRIPQEQLFNEKFLYSSLEGLVSRHHHYHANTPKYFLPSKH